jgi:endo-1,3-1,4-beta-glycanase ExoK
MTASLIKRVRIDLGVICVAAAGAAVLSVVAVPSVAWAQSGIKAAGAEAAEGATGKSFLDDFDRLDGRRWFISDGWNNGKHQNCTWSRKQVAQSDGKLTLEFAKRTLKHFGSVGRGKR